MAFISIVEREIVVGPETLIAPPPPKEVAVLFVNAERVTVSVPVE